LVHLLHFYSQIQKPSTSQSQSPPQANTPVELTNDFQILNKNELPMEGLMEILNATLSDAVTEAPRAECGGGAWCSKDLKDF